MSGVGPTMEPHPEKRLPGSVAFLERALEAATADAGGANQGSVDIEEDQPTHGRGW
jgi:hypothetical protein